MPVSPRPKSFLSHLLGAIKASVDAQESPWLPPWCRGRNEHERAVRKVRAIALHLIRKQSGESAQATMWRALAWPVLLPVKAWKYALDHRQQGFCRKFIRGFADLACYNIRPDALWAVRAQHPQEPDIPRLYITDRENQAILGHLNQGAPHADLGDKFVFDKFCVRHTFPHIPLLAHGVDSHHTQLSPWPSTDLFAKPTNLWGGQGAEILTRSQHGIWHDQHGATISSDNLATWAAVTYGDQPWLIQPRLQIDPTWSGWSSGALGTVRIVTAVASPKEPPEIIAASMRLPRSHMIVDNFSEGGLSAEIDWRTGLLGPALGHDGSRPWHDYHPDTQGIISGAKIPQWSKLCALACTAHAATPDLTAVGWDISCHQGSPILIEANPVFNLAPTVILGDTRWLDAILHRRSEL